MTASTAVRVSVTLLGSFSLRLDGRPVRKWRAGKARSLFQYLLVHRDRVVLRDKLHEVLWPHSDWSPNSSSLKVAMHALRQILQTSPDGTNTSGVRIVHQDFGYALYADGISVDVDEFEAMVEAGRAADKVGDTPRAVAAYRAAMEVYQGDFLPGDSADWIVEQREWCKSLALRALDRLSTEAARVGDFDQLVRWCRRTIELDPYRESAYQMVMSAHGRFGELAAVRRWHDMCTRRLAEELGVRPNQETERAYFAAMRGEGRAAAPLRAVPGPRVVRPHRALAIRDAS
ncbi:BTAD domain-containing putative transcriptional regulator [Actinokineospora auranticolor]|uniref:Transcriptional regulator n=1 Tax=Actinokineospora auranticolor TaxID=155976 RepID=A0A2S6GDG5_9PSEU|nr:BTAD domain-containing putative transcriptional regulator [Actinokineospora auranticolor]PPK63136.1 transcriptional regulator [Actinokineospora auranticolor]